jgi:hypothetical protein
MLMKFCLSICLFLSCVAGFAQVQGELQKQAMDYALPVTAGVTFEENRGQWDARVKYRTGTGPSVCQVMSTGLSFGYIADGNRQDAATDIGSESGTDRRNSSFFRKGFVWNLEFAEPSPDLDIQPVHMLEQVSHYYKGRNPADWATGCRFSTELLMSNVWDRTDIRLYGGAGDALEYDIIIHPGADPGQVRFLLKGPLSAVIAEDGSLELQTPYGIVKKSRPYAYQVIKGVKTRVDAAYELQDGVLSFRCGHYDAGHDLVIDPLVWSTWVTGSTENSYVYDIAADPAGNTYITGYCTSMTFPTVPGSFSYTFSGNYYDAIITKVKPDGSGILFTAFIDGEDLDMGMQVFYEAPYVYMSGSSKSKKLPVTAGAHDTALNGYYDAFYVKLTEDGSTLLQCSYLGGSGTELNSALFVRDEQVIIGGRTNSTDFAVSSGSVNTTGKGYTDIFLFKYDTRNSNLVLSNLIGGSGEDQVSAIVEYDGKIFLGGYTSSADLGTTLNAYSRTMNGNSDAFIIQVDALSNQLLYATYFGGSGMDDIKGIYVEFGKLYVAGHTSSNNLPVTLGAYQTGLVTSQNAFVLKFSVETNTVHYCTYLGTNTASGIDLVVKNGFAIVIGTTGNGKNFPQSDTVSAQSMLSNLDVFVAEFNETGSKMVYSTILGGGSNDYVPSIARNQCHVYASATSHSAEFPTTVNAFMPNKVNNHEDAMLVFQLDLEEKPQLGAKPRRLPSEMNLCASKGKVKLSTGFRNTVWSTGDMDSTITVTRTGIYHAYIYSTCDSIYHDSCIVDSIAADIHLGKDTLFCSMPFKLRLNAFRDSCTWSTGDTTESIEVVQPGIYWVSSTAFCSTGNTDSIEVKYLDEDSLFILPGDSILCNGDTMTLVSGTDSTFWSTGGQGRKIQVTQAGIYSARAYNSCRQMLTDTFVYDSMVSPKLRLRNDTLICAGTVLLVLESTYDSTNWSTGVKARAIKISQGGIYRADIRDRCDHVSRDTFVLDLDTAFMGINLPGDTVFCGPVFTYDLHSSNDSTRWSDGTTGRKVTVNKPGLYTGTNTNRCGENSSDSVMISAVEVPEIRLPNDTVICGPFSMRLDAGHPKTVWSGGVTNRYLNISKPGIYTAYYGNQCGSGTDTFIVYRDSSTLPFFIPNAFSPDGNGVNEMFPQSTANIAEFNMSVFNAWGQKIYEGNVAWDGQFMDETAMQGVYMWLISYRDCGRFRYFISGTVTLLR